MLITINAHNQLKFFWIKIVAATNLTFGAHRWIYSAYQHVLYRTSCFEMAVLLYSLEKKRRRYGTADVQHKWHFAIQMMVPITYNTNTLTSHSIYSFCKCVSVSCTHRPLWISACYTNKCVDISLWMRLYFLRCL